MSLMIISSFSSGSQIHSSTSTKQGFVQTRIANQFKPIIRKRPNAAAATVSWAAPTMIESLYETLGISEKGTFLEIKRAYKQLARKFHPDVSHDPERVDEFTRRFIQIQEAYHTLSDPKTRALYDRDMALQLSSGFKPPSYCSGMGWEWRYQVDELVRQSTSRRNTWGARMRRQNNEQPQS